MKMLKPTPGPVVIHSQGSMDGSTELGPNIPNTSFTYGIQASSSKKGDTYWHQPAFLELTVGAGSGENSPEETLPMPPEEAIDQEETEEAAEADPHEAEDIERLRRLARNFANDTAEGDDLRDERTNHFMGDTRLLPEEEHEFGVWIGEFGYDIAEVCDYDTHPINWKPTFWSGVFMMPPMRYDVKDSDGRICPKKATVVERNLNRIRRKFLRLMMSEMGSTPEEALRLTDNELLENWYAWHVAEHTRGAAGSVRAREP
jgi:hypothetical protein